MIREINLPSSIHQLHIVELTDDIHLAVAIQHIAGRDLQLVGIGIVDSEGAVLDHIDDVAAADLLDAGHIAVTGRDDDAGVIRIEDRQTAANFATGDIDIGAAVRTYIELLVLAYLHAIVVTVGDHG